jgi:hypothetical protein
VPLDVYGHWWPDSEDSLRIAVQNVLGDDDTSDESTTEEPDNADSDEQSRGLNAVHSCVDTR